MTKADHHRVVMQAALNRGTVPKGLQADITPHIFKETELVRAEWNDAHREFITRLTKILANHHATTVEDEMSKQASLQASILQMFSQANLSSRQRIHYAIVGRRNEVCRGRGEKTFRRQGPSKEGQRASKI